MQNPPLTILVVDDVPQNLLAMQALLAGEWQQVLCAGSGPEALEQLLMHEVALALLDVQMPGMDGYALAELMRGSERTRHVPIIFLTAGSREDSRTFRGYEAGAVDFLYKPVDPYVLRTKVDVFLDLQRQRQRLNQRVSEHERLLRVHGMLLRSLSHDLREPLAALNMNAESLLRKADQAGVAPIALRIKANAAIVSRHVDHLVNLGRATVDEMQPDCSVVDMAGLMRERIAESAQQGLWLQPPRLAVDDDPMVECDPLLVGDAINQIMLHLALHAGESVLEVQVDGRLREALVLRWTLPTPLGEGSSTPLPSVAPGDEVALDRDGAFNVEPMHLASRAAHAHGGTLVVRSGERTGTSVEMMLPRAQGDDGRGAQGPGRMARIGG